MVQHTTFAPFKNDNQSVGLTSQSGELTLENQGQQVNLYGSATFTLDKDSLDLARQLQQVLTDMIVFLEQHQADERTHENVTQVQQANVSEVANPFN